MSNICCYKKLLSSSFFILFFRFYVDDEISLSKFNSNLSDAKNNHPQFSIFYSAISPQMPQRMNSEETLVRLHICTFFMTQKKSSKSKNANATAAVVAVVVVL